MIYLSQLILNPHSRMAQKEAYAPYQLHRTLMRGFNMPREQADVLYRFDTARGNLRLLVQSSVRPDWTPLYTVGQGHYLQGGVDRPKQINVTLPQGKAFRFRLRANPTVKKRRAGKKHSNRVPLVHEQAQIDWLRKKADLHGFALRGLTVHEDQWLNAQIHRSAETTHKVTHFSVQYDGVLAITDAEKFNHAWRTGIGPAKAFGCGLLSLAPA